MSRGRCYLGPGVWNRRIGKLRARRRGGLTATGNSGRIAVEEGTKDLRKLSAEGCSPGKSRFDTRCAVSELFDKVQN